MTASRNPIPHDSHPFAALHAAFLAIVPRIVRHGRVYFRHVRNPSKKEEYLAEMVALGWAWFLRLAERGKDAGLYPSALASYLARAVYSGRRVCGHEKAKDVLSPFAQRHHGFGVERLHTSTRAGHEQLYATPEGQHHQDAFEERLCDNTITPVPDQVQFRIDFPAWLATLTGRERRIIRAMAQNERTRDLSRQFEVSPARISQLRQDFQIGWRRFTADRDDLGGC